MLSMKHPEPGQPNASSLPANMPIAWTMPPRSPSWRIGCRFGFPRFSEIINLPNLMRYEAYIDAGETFQKV